MRFVLAIALASWVAGLAPLAGAAPANLIQNASFERIDAHGAPRLWHQSTWGGQATFSVESEFGHTGDHCLKISSTEGADASWSFPVSVRPRSRYRLSAWIKTSQVETRTGLGALVNLHELQKVGKTPAVAGTTDWTLVTSEFESGPHRRLLVNVLLGGWGRSVGEAWYDDIELVEIVDRLPELTEEERVALYEGEVHPILEANCYGCHGPESKLKGDLFLGSREGVLEGGESGPAVLPDAPLDSPLLSAVNYEIYQMPPKGKLSRSDIAVLTRWVRLGAPWSPRLESERPAGEKKKRTPQVDAETRAFWSFQKVRRPEVPRTRDDEWAGHPVDAFVHARLERAGHVPAPAATRHELVRRAYYDLTGLPPSPEEVTRFVHDRRPDAWERLLDHLLASPHYGEKWGRHWLDLVRYAESNSFERDNPKPFVWRYRDYVIRSFNEDKPFDRFAVEQLAGDELPEPDSEAIIATGYYRLGQWDDEPADPEQALYDELDDILGTTGQAFLGLTLNCARCHDHKLDPIPQDDYYRMLAFFRNVWRYGVRSHKTVLDASVRDIGTPEEKERSRVVIAAHEKNVTSVRKRLAEIEGQVSMDFSDVEKEEFKHENHRVSLVRKRAPRLIEDAVAVEYERLTRRRDELRRNRPPGLAQALCVKERGTKVSPTHVLIRGNPHVPGKRVEPGFPTVLGFPDPEIVPPPSGDSSGRRLALARWITSPENPLTARVLMNRVWQGHFGRGIVRSPNNFGLQGDAPTHPDLLDWLAAELVEGGWTLKRMHRLVMTSRTYRMSIRGSQALRREDPLNALLGRHEMRRLSAEEIRDSILTVNGRLNRKMFGPSIYPIIPAEVLAGQSRPGNGWGKSSERDRARRSIYIHVKRSLLTPILETFDMADTDFTCPVRFQTIQPTQALTMLNSGFLNDQARVFGAHVGSLTSDRTARVRLALERALQRDPSTREVLRGVKLIETLKAREDLDEEAAFAAFCVVVLNLNEFLYLD